MQNSPSRKHIWLVVIGTSIAVSLATNFLLYQKSVSAATFGIEAAPRANDESLCRPGTEYESQSLGGIQSQNWRVFTSAPYPYFYTAKGSDNSRLWGYSNCEPGDVMVGARLHAFPGQPPVSIGAIGIDVLCCEPHFSIARSTTS